mgnify:CR=1 FL=1
MSSHEVPPQELPLSAEQQHIWRALVRRKALRSLEVLEAFYLSEEEQGLRKNAGLTKTRYNEWLAWMEKMDADPAAPFKNKHFVDEGALVENAKMLIHAMEALEELRTMQRLSEGTKQKLGMERLEHQRFIFVPDIDAVELAALAEEELDLTYLNPDYERWDFYRGLDGRPIPGRGKVFEVMTWHPERSVSSEEVHEHFKAEGFCGHTGAFAQWRRTCGLAGYHTSIPEDNGCWRGSDGRLYAPVSGFYSGSRRLNHGWVDSPWDNYWSFVAFREV